MSAGNGLRLCAKVPVVVGVAFLTLPLMLSIYGLVLFADWRATRKHARI